MKAYLRGSAFDSSEGNHTFLKIDGQTREMPQKRGLNTVILHSDGKLKLSGNHDVYGNAGQWNNWATWINANSVPGDIIAVATYDALRNAPRTGTAATLLNSVGVQRVFNAEQGLDWRRVRVPYSLLFIYGSDQCIEELQPYQGPNAHIKKTLLSVYLRGSAFDSIEGNNTYLLVDGKAVEMSKKRGLNTVVLDPDGNLKKQVNHDVFGNQNHWNSWANWIKAETETDDIVAVATYDALRNAPGTGEAANLLNSIGARKAFRATIGNDWRRVRSPYALLFKKGSSTCMEEAQPHRGNNAHLRTTLISNTDKTQLSSRPTLKLDGQGDYLSTEINVSEKEYTVSIWFKTKHANCGLFSIDAGDRGQNGHDRHVYLHAGNIKARLWRNEVIATSGVNFADGRWHRVTHVFGSGLSGQRIYVDGVLEAEGRKNQSDFTGQTGLNIGFSNDASNSYFQGEIAEVSLWSIARSERDIRAWQERVAGNETGLQAFWAFGERKGNLVHDLVGQRKHATIHGNPKWSTTQDFPGAFLLNIIPEELDNIRNQGEELAKVGSSLGKGYEEHPPEALPAKPLSELIDLGQVPHYALMQRLLANISEDGRLTLSQTILGEFGEIGQFAADILDVFVTIDQPKIEFTTGQPGMTGSPGMEVAGDPATSTKLATPEDHALKVSGGVSLFGGFGFKLEYADFFHYKGKPKCSFKFIGRKDLGIGTFLPGVPLIQALKLSSPTLIVCNASTLYDPTLDSGINEGFNFFGSMKIANSDDDIMQFIGGLFKVRELAIHAAIDTSGLTPKILLEAAIQRDLLLLNGDGFKLRFTRSDLGIELSGKPMEPTVSVSQDLVLSLRKDGEDTHLVFTGGIKMQAESISGFFTMNGTGRHPEGGLTGTVQNSNEWKEPFGIPGIIIRQMAVQLGGTYAAPWIDNVGVHGNLKIGDVDGSISVLVDSNDPDQFVLAGSSDRLTMIQIMSFMSPATFIAYQALPTAVRNTMNNVVDVKLEDVKVNIVPSATSIGGVHFRDEGVTIMGKMTAWGWKASTFVNVDTFDGITVRGDMDPINIHNFFKITGAAGDPAPSMRMQVSPHSTPYLYFSAKIYLLGLSREMRIEADHKGLSFLFKERWGNILTNQLTCTYGNGNFEASGSINFNLNLDIPTKWGKIKLVDIGLNAATTIKAGKDHGFYLAANGSFRFYGSTISMPDLRLHIAPNDFQALYNAVVKLIRDEALALFAPVFGTLGEWAQAVEKGVIAFSGEVAHIAKNVYHRSKEEAVRTYKTLKKGANEAANGLKNVYRASSREVAKALKDAHYAVNDVAKAMENAFHLGANETAKILREVGYTAQQVGNALKSAFNMSTKGMAIALKYAGFGLNEVAKTVKQVFNLSSKALASALKGAGYTANQIGNGLKHVFNLSAQGMAEALKYAGFGVSEVGRFVKDVYNLGPEALNSALKGAGYAAKEIEGFFNSLGGAFANMFKEVEKIVNPSKW